MNSIPTRWTGDNERGAVLIEFGLVLPVLLVLFAGMFDLGLAFQRFQGVTNAAREGARMAVLPGYSTADVASRVRAYLAASGVPGTATIVVTPILITPVGGGALFTAMKVHVQVTHVFTLLGPIATMVGGTFGTAALTSESVMRVEVSGGG
jgi:Flp pilus assembly protein TadG